MIYQKKIKIAGRIRRRLFYDHEFFLKLYPDGVTSRQQIFYALYHRLRYVANDRRKHFLSLVQNKKCYWCNNEFEFNHHTNHPRSPTKDHIIPARDGGKRDLYNIVLACYSCNQARGPSFHHPITQHYFDPIDVQNDIRHKIHNYLMCNFKKNYEHYTGENRKAILY